VLRGNRVRPGKKRVEKWEITSHAGSGSGIHQAFQPRHRVVQFAVLHFPKWRV
jgi:hypothetical protein